MTGFTRFNKQWASTGATADPTDSQANAGFAFIGTTPPSLELFNSIIQDLDDKDNWLYGNIASALANAGLTPADGVVSGLVTAIRTLAVQQAGGIGQTANKLNIGWSAAGKLKLSVDGTDLGYFALESSLNDAIGVEATIRHSEDVSLQADYIARDAVITAAWNAAVATEGGYRNSQDVALQGDYIARDTGVRNYIDATFATGAQLAGSFNGAIGWQRFPNGVILQWGSGGQANQTGVYFPLSFPNGVMSITVTEANTSGWTAGSYVSVVGSTRSSNSAFIYNAYYIQPGGNIVASGGNAFNWMAVGW
jgi:hypothetical protein